MSIQSGLVHFSQGGPSIDSGGSWYRSWGVNEVSAYK